METLTEAQALEQVACLERAATLILAPPSQVSNEDRKSAELLFHSLRESKLSPQICKYILETSKNDFVLFEVAQMWGTNLLKEWSVTETPVIEDSYRYLIQYAVNRADLVSFVRAEVFRSCAKLFKRGLYDHKTGDTDLLYGTIENLLSNEDQRLQSMGCELVDVICAEFSSSWRAANLGITWDFHLRAKKGFEAVGLRRLFSYSLRTLHKIVNDTGLSSPYHESLCDKFLRVSETILSWNFSSRILPARLAYCTETAMGAALRPPSSWRALFQDDDLLNLFFQLHTKIRSIETLRNRSISCLVQLSSVIGEVLTTRNSDSTEPQDHYLSLFISNFLETFKNGPLEGEITGFCTVIYKLFTFHKAASFARIANTEGNNNLLSNFLLFIVQYLEHFTPIAMQKALVEDERSYHESLVQIYDGWLVFLRGSERSSLCGSLKEPTFAILSAFLRSLFSPPIGSRIQVTENERVEENEQDDRELFSDSLVPIGHFAVFCIDQILPMFISCFKEKLSQFYGFLESGVSDEVLNVWREDMHWLLLLIGFSLTGEDVDGSCHVPGDVYEYCVEQAKKGISSPANSSPFLLACIEHSRSIPDHSTVDPVIQITGLILAWCSLEHSILLEGGAALVSPELNRSSLWCLRRLTAALSITFDSNDEDKELLPTLEVRNEFSRRLIEFSLQKTFTILNKLSGETKLCNDAVNLLVGLVDSRAPEMAASELLFSCLAGLQLDRLPARRALIQALVLIGAAAEDESLQLKMYVLILEPLSRKFMEVSAGASSQESDIADLLDCFCGVAQSAQQHSAHVLFKFLSPILSQCVVLLSSRKDSQLLTNCVLELFDMVTRKLAIYVEDSSDSQMLYQVLLELLQVYRKDQLDKYRSITVDDEEKATDLILILDILGNVMSKDILLTAVTEGSDVLGSGSRVAFTGLEMLLPLIEEQLLKMPTLCVKFYRLILYFVEMAPECVGLMSDSMLGTVIECLRFGLQSHFGQEVATVSVEAVDQIATYFASQDERGETVVARLATLIENTFAMCLEVSCQMDIFNLSTHALYSLICCSKAAFVAFVEYLLLREQHAAVRPELQAAFSALLPAEDSLSPNRRGKREFRDRFEKFLNNIQGLLVIN